MPSWITTKNVNTGDYFDVQRWNNIVSPYGNLSYFQNLVGATSTNVQVTQTSQSIATATFTTVTWSSATIPNTNMWTTGSDIILPSTGIYFIIAELRYVTSITGVRYTRLEYSSDGGANFSQTALDSYSQAATTYPTITWFTIRNRINTGGRIRIVTYQSSGIANILNANLTVQKLGDLYDY
jgi:hypothetical protein